MKILLITQLFPFKKGIKETSGAIREFAEEWGKMGHLVKVLRPHFSYEKEPFPDNPNFHISNNIEVNFIKPFRIPLLKLIWYSRKKTEQFISFKPDIIICHLYNSYFTFHWLAEKLNIPLIIGIHISDIKISNNKFHRWHQNLIFKKSSAFACRSYSVNKLFQKQFPKFKRKTFIALSGIPEEFLNNRVKKKNNKKIRIISISSLIKRKQIDKVLLALFNLPENIDWEYIIIGSGPKQQNLKSLIKKLNLTDNVKMFAHKPRKNIIKELDQSDIFILPSYHETLGLVYLEAMARGCITIGSINSGVDGIIIDKENGFLCDPYNNQSIRDKLIMALSLDNNEKVKIINNAKETVSSFTIKKKSEEYIKNISKFLK